MTRTRRQTFVRHTAADTAAGPQCALRALEGDEVSLWVPHVYLADPLVRGVGDGGGCTCEDRGSLGHLCI